MEFIKVRAKKSSGGLIYKGEIYYLKLGIHTIDLDNGETSFKAEVF
jgi:hypothetical protein